MAAEPKKTESKYGYVITDNVEYGSIEIKFDGKPSEAIRAALKARKFRWNGKKGIWYGRAEHESIRSELDGIFAEENKPAEVEQKKSTELVPDETGPKEIGCGADRRN